MSHQGPGEERPAGGLSVFTLVARGQSLIPQNSFNAKKIVVNSRSAMTIATTHSTTV